MARMKYRLGLDIGTSSLGWAIFRLDPSGAPCAIIKTGVRIFSDGRHPKTGESLAVARRNARAMRRRRDRLLKRKKRMMNALIAFGFFPADEKSRKAMEQVSPYVLRKRGLDEQLTGPEFARALLHMNVRRGFKSNRKTDTDDNEAGAILSALQEVSSRLALDGARTIGEWLAERDERGETVRARMRETSVVTATGKKRKERKYDLYVSRELILKEFDALWATQVKFNPGLFSDEARQYLRDTLSFQRPLRPVEPGRCTLMPGKPRAPLAHAVVQQVRILQELNHLRIESDATGEVRSLTLEERDLLWKELERREKLTFSQIRKLLKLSKADIFNLEDEKRDYIKGNDTASRFYKVDAASALWDNLGDEDRERLIALHLDSESDTDLIGALLQEFEIDNETAASVAKIRLPQGYSSLSLDATKRIVAALRGSVIPYSEAVKVAGFDHHSDINQLTNGEVLPQLPYYGEILTRHVAFGSGVETDPPEKRFGKIANPTVHVALNQVRVVVNALIRKYGHPQEIVVELARDLKSSKKQRLEAMQQQKKNQDRNDRIRSMISGVQQCHPLDVSRADIEKVILWEELAADPLHRRCPYTGQQISLSMLLSAESSLEVDHIIPFSRTLDDSLNNRVVSMAWANRIKGNRTPWEAFGSENVKDIDPVAMLERVREMPKSKRFRFETDAYEVFLRDHSDFVARALTDTQYMARIAKFYLDAICPGGVQAIPGRLTAMVRGQLGLNTILGLNGEKNRDDHRHHAVDAVVVAVTDRALLNRLSKYRGRGLAHRAESEVRSITPPFEGFRDKVARSIDSIIVSHKPDHGYQAQMLEDSAWGYRRNGTVVKSTRADDGQRVREIKDGEKFSLIGISEHSQPKRHGILGDGTPKPYKGYKGGSNYAIFIDTNGPGKWKGEVVSTFEKYRWTREGKSDPIGPGVYRLMAQDCVSMIVDGARSLYRIVNIKKNTQITFAAINESNVNERNNDPADPFKYVTKLPGPLGTAGARFQAISPIGELKRIRR